MTDKPTKGLYGKDGSKYGCLVDGDGNLVSITTTTSVTPKQLSGSQAPDGSIYFTLTNGSGALV